MILEAIRTDLEIKPETEKKLMRGFHEEFATKIRYAGEVGAKRG